MEVKNISMAETSLRSAIDEVWSTLPPVWNRIRSNIRATAVEQYGIRVEQFHILRHIRRGFTSVSELAEVLQISRSAVSQAVDVLVERGLIRRRQNAQDRRNIPLELTDDGNRLLDAIWEKNRAWMGEKMANLTPADLTTLSNAMELLATTFMEQ